AARCLKAAVAKKPDSAAYLDSFGVLLSKMGNNAAAQKAFEKALLRAPNESEIMDHMRALRDSVKG
ncbi:MAG: hypothetical protein HY042_06230, partial [Spirochaetia bacterium]|nr:hypothetical protein [Spirochaetia bacterium]